MALVKCRECKTEVSTDAKACPKCGTPNFHPGWTKNPALNTGCAVILLGAMGVCGLRGITGGGGGSAPAAEAGRPRAVNAPTIEVENRKLWNDYEANEVAADDAYKGKRLKVTGVVASIDKNVTNDVVITLASPNEFMNTMAAMEDSESKKAAALKKGAKIVLVCEGNGRIVGTPSLADCVFAP